MATKTRTITVVRSAVNGQFVKASKAVTSPKTTEKEVYHIKTKQVATTAEGRVY